ncbi:hypothetical protein [Nitrosospira sp. NRS527]|uniref:hypothetical protein n=1 Tax=Nitrosospira sp. NRS527 TaxID=155925 RepID=UPI001AF08EDC|nr:hypothetical protein [Nitrosospira sp. NRS527]BCT68818.1 hypothetical protein NNRS527_02424 [Nitrosospira sp. NRS527]
MAPRTSHESPCEAEIVQLRKHRDRVLRAWGARIPLRGRTFLRKALLSCTVTSRVVALFFAQKTAHPFRPTAGFKIIEFILSTKKVVNKEIPFCD